MIDMVDMLHSAEDLIGVLRSALETVAAHAAAQPHTGLADAPDVLQTINVAIGAANDYCRCECDEETGTYLCDGDCGCPADHEHPHPPQEDVR